MHMSCGPSCIAQRLSQSAISLADSLVWVSASDGSVEDSRKDVSDSRDEGTTAMRRFKMTGSRRSSLQHLLPVANCWPGCRRLYHSRRSPLIASIRLSMSSTMTVDCEWKFERFRLAVFNFEALIGLSWPRCFRSPQYTYEGCVPYEQTGATLVSLDEWLRAELAKPKGLRGHFPIEIRFTDKDDIFLSPTYGMRGTYIGAIQYRCVPRQD